MGVAVNDAPPRGNRIDQPPSVCELQIDPLRGSHLGIVAARAHMRIGKPERGAARSGGDLARGNHRVILPARSWRAIVAMVTRHSCGSMTRIRCKHAKERDEGTPAKVARNQPAKARSPA